MVDEIETDLTRNSINAARSVCSSLQWNPALSTEQRGAMVYAEAILFEIVEQLDERGDDSNERVIPIPPEVMDEELMMTVMELVHDSAEGQ